MAKKKKKKKQAVVRQMSSPIKLIQQKGRNLELDQCWLMKDWQEINFCQIFIVRKHQSGKFTVAIYLVDLLCQGVKDTSFHFNIDEFEKDELLKAMHEHLDMELVDYTLVHNIIYGAVDFGEEFEIKSHKDFYKVTQFLLEDDDDEIELIEISLGHEGLPAVTIDSNAPASFRANELRIANHLEKVAGPDNYVVIEMDYDVEDDLM